MTRAVFLDRDGVLNEAVVREGRPYPPSSARDLRIFPDARVSLDDLKDAGFLLIVVTNQPDVARGTLRRETLNSINQAIAAALPVDEIVTCCHDDADGCACRKPKPGLLIDAASRHKIDLPASFMIGDRWRDLDAGSEAGCTTILIDHQYRERAPRNPPAYRAISLRSAADWILGKVGKTIPG